MCIFDSAVLIVPTQWVMLGPKISFYQTVFFTVLQINDKRYDWNAMIVMVVKSKMKRITLKLKKLIDKILGMRPGPSDDIDDIDGDGDGDGDGGWWSKENALETQN